MHYEISDLPTIPADRSSWGAFAAIAENTNVRIVKMFKAIDADKKSVAVEVTLQPRERTLTDKEIEEVAGRIVAEVAKKTSATLRA